MFAFGYGVLLVIYWVGQEPLVGLRRPYRGSRLPRHPQHRAPRGQPQHQPGRRMSTVASAVSATRLGRRPPRFVLMVTVIDFSTSLSPAPDKGSSGNLGIARMNQTTRSYRCANILLTWPAGVGSGGRAHVSIGVKGVAVNLWHRAAHFRCSPEATVGSRNVAVAKGRNATSG